MSALIPRILQTARRRRGTLCVAVLLLVLAAVPTALRIQVDPNVLNLLPRSGPAVSAFRTYLSSFGSFDRVYIVFEAPEGRTVEEYAGLVDRYAELLRGAPEMTRVDTQVFEPGKDWGYVFDHLLLLLGPEKAAEALEGLAGPDLDERVRQARSRLLVPSPAMTGVLRQDPLNLLGLLRERLSAANAFVRIDPAKEGYVSPDGRARLVIATPTKPPFDSLFCRRVDALLRRTETEARSRETQELEGETLPPIAIRYAGGYHLALEAEGEVRREAVLNALGSLAGILLLLVLVFRSAWLLVVGALPMAVAGFLAAAVNAAWHPQFSAAAAGASALLFGLGIDGLVLLYARYLEERPTSGTAQEAVGRLSGSAASMLLGMMTSAATFLALTLVTFPALQELGRLIGLGMLLGGILTFLLVPALLPSRAGTPRALTARWLPAFVERRRRPLSWGAVALTLALLAPLPSLRLDLSLQRLQPRTPQMAYEREMVRRFGLPEDIVVVIGHGRDLQALLDANERLGAELARRNPGLPLFAVTSVLPTAERQARVGEVVAGAGVSRSDLERRLDAAAARAGFRPEVFAPFLERAGKMLDPSARLTLQGYRQHGLADMVSPYLVQGPEGYVTAAYLRPGSKADVEAVRAAAKTVGGPLRVTGVPLVNEELSARLLPQFLLGVTLGALAVFALMWLTFRDVRLTALALLPTALGLAWSAGILALLGVVIDLFSLFGVLAFIGIGVDYGIHLVHRYASEGDLGEALARIAPVNLVAAGIAVLGCGTLITSRYPPLQSLGVVSVVTLVTCLAGSLLVLPAILPRRQR